MSFAAPKKYARLVSFGLLIFFSMGFASTGLAEKPKTYQLDSPEGMAIHRGMMQMQSNQQAFQKSQADAQASTVKPPLKSKKNKKH